MKLKPCPFCGDKHVRISRTTIDLVEEAKYSWVCLHCGATTGHPLLTREETIKAWNTRTPDTGKGGVMKMETPFYKELLSAARNVTDWDWPEILRYAEESGDWSDDLKKLEEVVMEIYHET